MLKRFIAVLLTLAVVLGLSACKIQVEDTASNGLKWGNTLSAEQGDWIALRGEEKGKVGILLYNKKKEKSEFMVEGDLYHIALLNNTLYYKYLQGSELYSFDLVKKEQTELLSGVMAYQIHGDTIYYLSDEHGEFLHTYNITTGESGKRTFKHTVNAFWVTDHGIYYHDDGKNLFIVCPFETGLESIIYRGIYEDCRDVMALDGADIAFMIQSETKDQTTLCTYDAENAKVTKLYTGFFSHYNVAGDRLVTVYGEDIISIDPASGEVFSWGSTEGYYYPQVMSNCVILYEDEDGRKPVLQYYPETK
ncbi:MAG: DUF5050 domain-containing protein [Clostridia bacterium]|nr:DUF5050 domain-containing protein [Clostridia bacterium]